jgi:hypothetical protein
VNGAIQDGSDAVIKLGTTRSFQLHVALHDPARVLREIEAKRLVLARHVLSLPGGRLSTDLKR